MVERGPSKQIVTSTDAAMGMAFKKKALEEFA